MRRLFQAVTLAAVAVTLPQAGLVAPAEAGLGWTVGGTFSVGGLDFAVVYDRPSGTYRPYAPATYYRVHRPLRYRGYSCHSSCSYRAGSYYHHADCPLVRHHFRRHRYYPERAPAAVYPAGYGHRYYDRGHSHRFYRYEAHGYSHHQRRGYGHPRHRSHHHSKHHKKHYKHACCHGGGHHHGW